MPANPPPSVLDSTHSLTHFRQRHLIALTRTNLTLPEELLAEVDSLAGPRGRSRYVAEAVAQRVKRDKLGKAIRETAGILVGTPYQMTRDEVTAWVEELRSEVTD